MRRETVVQHGLHGALIAVLFALCFLLPDYHQGNLARILVLATYAVGYNVLFGYTGLLSLGHAMFFAVGMYGMGLAMTHGGVPAVPAFLLGVGCAAVFSALVAPLALRTTGVAFLIVTLMFSQAVFLTILHFGAWTRGDDGFVIAQAARSVAGIDLTDPVVRYLCALGLFSVALLATARLMQVQFGAVLVGIRENEPRLLSLGVNTAWRKTAVFGQPSAAWPSAQAARAAVTARARRRTAARALSDVGSHPSIRRGSAGFTGASGPRRHAGRRRTWTSTSATSPFHSTATVSWSCA